MKILVTNIMMQKERARFEKLLSEQGLSYDFPRVSQFMKEKDLLGLVGSYDGWLAGDDEITREVLQKSLPRLKVISKWGTGIDSIDQGACQDLGVKLYNSPGAFRDTVSEVAMAYIIDLARKISYTDRQVRAGGWPKPKGFSLRGKALGIVGYGAIGQGLAEKALGFGMEVSAYDPYFKREESLRVKERSFDELVESSDFLVLACNMTSENRHMIHKEVFDKMKKGSYLVNVARGPLVNEEDLVGALESGQLAGAGLDVFELEPLKNSPLLNLEQVVLGSHNANHTVEAIEAVHGNTLSNLYKALGLEGSSRA